MKKYESIDIELDLDVMEKITDSAKEYNMTFNEFVNSALSEYMWSLVNKVTTNDYLKLLQKYEADDDSAFLKEYYMIVDSFGKPIVKISPVT
jgi:transcriptional regulatory protein LevR